MIRKYLIIITLGLAVISSVFVAVEASATGAEVRSLEEKKMLLQRENGELEETLVKGMSVNEMEGKSLSLGFSKPTELIYLNGNAGKDQALINTISR